MPTELLHGYDVEREEVIKELEDTLDAIKNGGAITKFHTHNNIEVENFVKESIEIEYIPPKGEFNE